MADQSEQSLFCRRGGCRGHPGISSTSENIDNAVSFLRYMTRE